MEEQWKDVPDTDGMYQVSSLGRVRRQSSELVEPNTLFTGHLSVTLTGAKPEKRRVHLLVLEAFVGKRPPNSQPVFADGDRSNCSATNLSWGPSAGSPKNKGTAAGDVVGNFEAVESAGYFGSGSTLHWRVQCLRCGESLVVQGQAFRCGSVTCDQCDQVLYEQTTQPADLETKPVKSLPEYKAWLDMKNRCKNRSGYAEVSVCPEWQNSFAAFFAAVGAKPGPDYSLDRIDPTGNYEPENCRWATRRQQNENRQWSVR